MHLSTMRLKDAAVEELNLNLGEMFLWFEDQQANPAEELSGWSGSDGDSN